MKLYKIFSRIDILNTPIKLIKKGILLDNNVKTIVSDETLEYNDFKVFNGIAVEPKLVDDGFNEEYFNTSIINRNVYAPYEAYSGYLPTNLGKFCITDLDNTQYIIEPNKCYYYKQIIFNDEKTISDLYANAYMYSYYPEADCYMILPEDGIKQNKIKYLLSRDISHIGGDQFDRIADYSRLILFLISKAYSTFTDEEKQNFQKLLPYCPKINSLNDLIHRECLIQEKVKFAKENPDKYIEEYGENDNVYPI